MKILITGGASGLGEAITIHLASNKENQVIFTYNQSADRAKELESQYPNVKSIKCDFHISDDIGKVEELIESEQIDCLINNAITGLEQKHFHKHEAQNWIDSFRANVYPIVRMTQVAIKVFKKKKFGKIITINSSATLNKPPTGMSEYVASRNYLLSLSKSWAAENIKSNVTSNSVLPSFMLTPLNQDTDYRVIEEMIAKNPLNRLVEPSEVAEMVGFLTTCTQQINGQAIVINGGENL